MSIERHHIFAALFLVGLLAAFGWALGISRHPIFKLDAPAVICTHRYSKWSKPVTVSNWYVGTVFSQCRTCELCGEVEMREVNVSPRALQ